MGKESYLYGRWLYAMASANYALATIKRLTTRQRKPSAYWKTMATAIRMRISKTTFA